MNTAYTHIYCICMYPPWAWATVPVVGVGIHESPWPTRFDVTPKSLDPLVPVRKTMYTPMVSPNKAWPVMGGTKGQPEKCYLLNVFLNVFPVCEALSIAWAALISESQQSVKESESERSWNDITGGVTGSIRINHQTLMVNHKLIVSLT